MIAALLVALKDFIFPEVLDYVEKYLAANGKLPTLDELNAEVATESNAGIVKGLAWLAGKGIK